MGQDILSVGFQQIVLQRYKMNWKNRYTIIKKGDKVKLIKYHPHCDGNPDCCSFNGYIIGKIYTVMGCDNEIPDTENKIIIENNTKCGFPVECFEKVL